MTDALIYLDNNASTAPDPLVVEAVTAAMRVLFANASSQHDPGSRAASAVARAREQVGALIGCPPQWVVFTSGATESDALALYGVWTASRLRGSRRDTIVVGATEHPAVLESARMLERSGARVCIAPVDVYGLTDPETLRSLVDDRTLLVSIMVANNETGTIIPLKEVVEIAKSAGALVHTDATQYVGRLPFDMRTSEVDLLSLSGHKMHGPKGVGALVVRRGVALEPLIPGGGHERGLRSGTLNTPGIVGLGVAAELTALRFGEADMIAYLRDQLHCRIASLIGDVRLNGHPTQRLPNTVNLQFEGAEADAVMASLRRVACSSGSACSAAVPSPSHVLLAMGLSDAEASQSLRFSLSRETTPEDIDAAVDDVAAAVAYVRAASAA